MGTGRIFQTITKDENINFIKIFGLLQYQIMQVNRVRRRVEIAKARTTLREKFLPLYKNYIIKTRYNRRLVDVFRVCLRSEGLPKLPPEVGLEIVKQLALMPN